ncbi:MAG: hypothetical protein K9G76_09870, partial [Bacteroidales bacterium]|nr:hypothetical protein [Bacteroidales bacterium]MCF8404006.1 hypothetical protein [Bacteroidales bacterium]
WMLKTFRKYGKENVLNQNIQVWQNFNSPTLLDNNQIIDQKTEYIRNNPVRTGFVIIPEDYKHSSASSYSPIKTLDF